MAQKSSGKLLLCLRCLFGHVIGDFVPNQRCLFVCSYPMNIDGKAEFFQCCPLRFDCKTAAHNAFSARRSETKKSKKKIEIIHEFDVAFWLPSLLQYTCHIGTIRDNTNIRSTRIQGNVVQGQSHGLEFGNIVGVSRLRPCLAPDDSFVAFLFLDFFFDLAALCICSQSRRFAFHSTFLAILQIAF